MADVRKIRPPNLIDLRRPLEGVNFGNKHSLFAKFWEFWAAGRFKRYSWYSDVVLSNMGRSSNSGVSWPIMLTNLLEFCALISSFYRNGRLNREDTTTPELRSNDGGKSFHVRRMICSGGECRSKVGHICILR